MLSHQSTGSAPVDWWQRACVEIKLLLLEFFSNFPCLRHLETLSGFSWLESIIIYFIYKRTCMSNQVRTKEAAQGRELVSTFILQSWGLQKRSVAAQLLCRVVGHLACSSLWTSQRFSGQRLKWLLMLHTKSGSKYVLLVGLKSIFEQHNWRSWSI